MYPRLQPYVSRAAILCIVTLKVYQQVNGGSLPAAVARIWRARGPRGFFPGFGLHCFLETVGWT